MSFRPLAGFYKVQWKNNMRERIVYRHVSVPLRGFIRFNLAYDEDPEIETEFPSPCGVL